MCLRVGVRVPQSAQPRMDPIQAGITTHNPSLAVLPLRSMTHSSKKRSMMGSRLLKGVVLNLLLLKISETLLSAAAGWLTARSSSERCIPIQYEMYSIAGVL